MKETVRVAVVQAAAVPFDSHAGIDKTVRLLTEAAGMGAKVVLFPEAFVPGYPKGLNYGLVIGARDSAGREEFRLYLDAAIEIPGPETERLGEAVSAHRVHLVIGMRNEKVVPATAQSSSSVRMADCWESIEN